MPKRMIKKPTNVCASTPAPRLNSGPPRFARASNSTPAGGHRSGGPPGGTGRPASGLRSTSAITSSISLRKARDRKSTRLNSSHANISYAVFCLKKKKNENKKSKNRRRGDKKQVQKTERR